MPRGVRKVLNICIIITIIVAIAFIALMFILRYIENGEENMPFEVSKITIVSTVDAQDVEDTENRWNEKVIQNNDIYIDVKKNDNFQKKRIIKSVNIENMKVTKKPKKGEIKFYKPSTSEVKAFENKEDYLASNMIFKGYQETDIKDLKISNQGGRIAFRCANENLGTYISNEDNELNYNKLLEKIGVSDEDIRSNISFDLEIALTNGQKFKAGVELQFPEDGMVKSGRTSKEITDLNIAFRRVEN